MATPAFTYRSGVASVPFLRQHFHGYGYVVFNNSRLFTTVRLTLLKLRYRTTGHKNAVKARQGRGGKPFLEFFLLH